MEQEIKTTAEESHQASNPINPEGKETHGKAIEVEEGEVNDSKHRSSSNKRENRSKVILLFQKERES